MNKFRKKMAAFAAIALIILLAAVAFAAEPGTDSDPLVSKSYIDNAISEVKSYVEEKLAQISTSSPDVSEGTGAAFEIVRLAEGQKITFGEGAEVIVRMGKGSVIASEKGGIADITAGCDLAQDEVTQANHLMIVPVDDGRGLVALEDVIVMVKGSYKIN